MRSKIGAEAGTMTKTYVQYNQSSKIKQIALKLSYEFENP